MATVLLVVHVLLSLALIIVVLLQRSEGGALGIGGGGGMSGFLTGRATANVLTRATAILAVLFMVTSVALAMIAGQGSSKRTLIEAPPATGAPAAPSGDGTAPAAQPTVPGADPTQPAAPSR